MTRYGVFFTLLGTRALIIWAAACWLLTGAGPVCADDLKPTEYQVKAAFLFNFARFADWPDRDFAGPATPFVFCILDGDPIGRDLDAVAGRTVNGRRARVRRLKRPGEARGCHILFISRQAEERAGADLRALGKSGALLVGETAGFAERGGMINFVIRDSTVGFEINPEAAARAGLVLNSRLLNMAVIVHDEGTPEAEGP